MKTLEKQLAEYCQHQEELHGPITPDELVARGSLIASSDTAVDSGESEVCEACGADLTVFDLRRLVESAPPAPRKRRAIVAAAVAAAILVVVGVVVADSDGRNVVTDEVSSPSVVEPVAPPAVADPVPPLWPLTFRDQAGRSEMSGVLAGGPGFVAVGGQRGRNAAVWTSVDGLTWSRVAHDEAVFGESYISAVIAGGPGLVAVGSAEGDEEDRRGPAAVWTSGDGLAWSRVPHDEAAFGEAEMTSVTVGGPGLVAVGNAEAGLGDRNTDAAVWTSIDGLNWSRVAHDETTFGGADSQLMMSVTAGGPGLVAVGYDGQGSWDNSRGQDAAVWTSVDGLTWSRVPHDEFAFGRARPAMLGVTTGGPGLVAVGYSFPDSRAPAVWTSVDGLAWSRVAHDNGADLSGTMRSVTAGGPGLIAVGAAVWTSPDGLTWSLAANGGEAEPGTYSKILDVSAANGRLVAVGRLDGLSGPGPGTPHEEPAAVWTSPDP